MKKIIIGNWKMNLDHLQAIQLLQKINYSLSENIHEDIDIVVAPSHTSLRSVQTVIDTDNLSIQSSAQDVSEYNLGSYTGETSSLQLNKLNIDYCILGHSERRSLFLETDEVINTKLKNLLKINITPIICIGETEEDRNQSIQIDKCLSQIRRIFKGVRKDAINECIIAYEPIWAIGTGIVAQPENASEILEEVKKYLLNNNFLIEKFRFVYGGSVTKSNAKDLMNEESINGLLVGGASLDPDEFIDIIQLSL